ncbi:MAG: flagellin, partial [Hespellia sp.]|nr:flagellin [Hespellia sp.]
MVELATQSANGTYSKANRSEMQKEIKALNAEIDRIGKTANFNGTTLFTGAYSAITLHVGESGSADNQIKVTLKAMNSTSITTKNLDITSSESARKAISAINAAIDHISSLRSDFGALQNRLEHTINNLGTQNENITAAESRIRDVDMAKEMMAYTKNNILVQASQAMLAQANQVPQGVLQLLQ